MSVFDDLVRDRALHAFKLTTDPTLPNKGLSQKAAVVNGAVESNGLPLYAGGEKPLAFTQSTSVKLTDTLHTDRTMECLYAPSTNDAGLIMRNGQVSVEEIAGVLRLNLYDATPSKNICLNGNFNENTNWWYNAAEITRSVYNHAGVFRANAATTSGTHVAYYIFDAKPSTAYSARFKIRLAAGSGPVTFATGSTPFWSFDGHGTASGGTGWVATELTTAWQTVTLENWVSPSPLTQLGLRISTSGMNIGDGIELDDVYIVEAAAVDDEDYQRSLSGSIVATNYAKNSDMSQTGGEVVVAENLMPDPSFEYGVEGWIAYSTGSVIEQDISRSLVGDYSLHCYGGTAPAITAIYFDNLKRSTTYTITVWGWQDASAAEGIMLRYHPNLGTATDTAPLTVRERWDKLTITFTTGTDDAELDRFYIRTATAGGEAWIDAVSLVEGNSSSLFTGDTPADDTFTYRWTGTPGASTSQKVARQLYGWSWNGTPTYQYIHRGRTWAHTLPGETSLSGAGAAGPRPPSRVGEYWAAKLRVYNFTGQSITVKTALHNGVTDGFLTKYPTYIPLNPYEEKVLSLPSTVPVSADGNTGPFLYFYSGDEAVLTDVVCGPVSGPNEELPYEYFGERSSSPNSTYTVDLGGFATKTLDYAAAPITADIEWDREQSLIALSRTGTAITLLCNDETVAVDVPDDFTWSEDDGFILAPTGGYADAFAIYNKVVSGEALDRHIESARNVPEYESVLNSLTPAPNVPLTDYEETPVDLDDTVDAPPAPYGYWMGTDNERIVTDTRIFDTSDDFTVADMLSVDIGDDEITGVHTEEAVVSTNYITNPAPASVTDMTGTGGGVTFDADHIVLTSSIDSVDNNALSVGVGQSVPATPDEESYFSSQVRSEQGIVTAVFATFYDATAVEIMTVEGESSTGSAEWEALSSSFTTPAGAATVQFSIGNASSVSMGDTIEAKQFTTVPADGYYDGDTEDDEVYRYDWSATAGASTSTKTAIEQFGTWTGAVPIPETTAKLAWQGAGDFTVSLSTDNGVTWQHVENNSVVPALPVDENSGSVDIRVQFGPSGGVVRRIMVREYQDSTIKGYLTERSILLSGDVTTNEEDNFPIEQNPLAGFRFNGGTMTVQEVVGSDSVQSVMFWIKPESAPVGNLLTVGTTTITSDLTGATVYVNGQAGGSLQVGAWNNVVITDISPTTADIVVMPPVGQVTMFTIMSETIDAIDAEYLYDCFFAFPRFQFSDADVTISEPASPFSQIQQDWGITSSY